MMRDDSGFEVDSVRASSSQNSGQAADSYVVDELKAEIARLSGRIEDLERGRAENAQTANSQAPTLQALDGRVSELEKGQLAILEVLKGKGKATTTPSAGGAAEVAQEGNALERGRALFQAGKFEPAIEALKQFLEENPKGRGPQTEECIYLLGESYFLLKQYQASIVEYSKLPEKFPNSKRLPGALLRIAQAFESMGLHEDAKGFYLELMDKYPKSPEAKKALEKQKSPRVKTRGKSGKSG